MIRTKDFKYVKRLDEKDELYNLKNDKENMVNLIDKPEYKEIVEDLRNKMFDWLQETCDVVPFEMDERLSKDMVLAIMKGKLSFGKYLVAKIALKGGMSVAKLMKIVGGKNQ